MFKKLLFGLFLGVVAVSCALPVFADPLDTWTKRVDGTNQELRAAAYGNSTFVVVGNNGTILSSPDGVTWTPRNVGIITENFNDVIYQNSLFVAVGNAGTICTSTNGTTWTTRDSEATNNWYGVAYGNNVFVAVGEYVGMSPGIVIDSVVTISSDGITWTLPATGITHGLSGIAFGNETFVAVGNDDIMMENNARVLTSTNGTTWTNNPITVESLIPNGIGFGNNQFVVVTNEGNIFTSPDGDTWTEQESGTTDILRKVAFGNDTFVVVGGDAGDSAVMLTSTDGEFWTNRINDATDGDTQLHGIGFGDNTFIAVGGNSSGTIFQSDPLPNDSDSSNGSLPVGPLAAGLSALLAWRKRRKQE
ncbi:MAG: cell wall-binding protein [Candidatus Ratteibacteria bacterium]|jgi:photosystem II stability/assembly factor-like uncharacterized protein